MCVPTEGSPWSRPWACWRTLARRPDAIIVFSGHNEFQAPFGWSRNVRHYVEEGPEHPLALIELARSASSTVKLILDTLDRFRGETPPPPRATRELVDHPICAPAEFAFLLEDFRRRLDARGCVLPANRGRCRS